MNVWEVIGIALMPLTYGFVGWLTNSTALWMTLYPLRFRGIPPWLGWQGLVPRRAAALALTAARMLREHVLDLDTLFDRLKPRHLQRGMRDLTLQVGSALGQASLAEAQKAASQAEVDLAAAAGPEGMDARAEQALATTTEALSGGGEVLNFKGLVLRSITGPNVAHMVEIFRSVGDREFAFIRRSGWIFGGLLGLGQAGVWLLLPQWWLLPLLGALVGGLTNWLALAMVFRPLHERRILGVRWQGLFLKRQAEVSERYAEVFAARVLSARNLLEETLHRPLARRLVDEADAVAGEALTKSGLDNALAAFDLWRSSSRKERVAGATTALAEGSAGAERLMARRLNVRETMSTRLKAMAPETFEPILRTAFQDDEHVLIVVGAVLGAVVGLGQALLMLAAA